MTAPGELRASGPAPDAAKLGSSQAGHRPGIGAVVRSEWTKLRSVRSTTWSLIATVVLTVAIGMLATGTAASNWSHRSLVDRLTFDPTSRSLTGLLFGQLAIGVLGVLTMSAEYGTGTIRATLAAVPRRWQVLVAKAVVFVSLALAVGEVVSFVAFFAGQAMLGSGPPHAALGQPGVLQAIVGGGVYLAILGLLALGIAAVVRHTAGAISAFVGVLFVLPLVVQALPTSLQHAVSRYLPAFIGAATTATRPGAHDLFDAFPTWIGLAILLGYALGAMVAGLWVLQRRDA